MFKRKKTVLFSTKMWTTVSSYFPAYSVFIIYILCIKVLLFIKNELMNSNLMATEEHNRMKQKLSE